MTALINSSKIVFNSLSESKDLSLGVFQLKFNDTSINAKIDQSTSMGDKCRDGKIKIEHAYSYF